MEFDWQLVILIVTELVLALNRIYNENCLDTMKKMPDKLVDLVVSSPPYNMNLRIRNGKYCSRQLIKEFSSKYVGFDDNMPIEQYYEFHSTVLNELLRIASIVFYNVQIVTGSKRAWFKIIGDNYDRLKDIIIWDKGHAQPAMQQAVLSRQSELILIFEAPERAVSRQFQTCNFERGTLNDVWQIKRDRKIASNHGATFPEALVERIILNFSNEGGLIYDPFMGTGTTAKVALDHGRNFIGSEISAEYCAIADTRIHGRTGVTQLPEPGIRVAKVNELL
jgi:site-specific DNA-methyltransferase (adenine-specific)